MFNTLYLCPKAQTLGVKTCTLNRKNTILNFNWQNPLFRQKCLTNTQLFNELYHEKPTDKTH